METVLERLNYMARRVADELDDLLQQSHVKYLDLSSDQFAFISVYGNYHWTELDVAGARQQGKVQKLHSRFREMISVILRDRPQFSDFKESDAFVRNLIDRTHPLYNGDLAAHARQAREKLLAQVAMLDRLYDSEESEVVLLADTNALLHLPALERWQFPEFPRFTILLTPAILSELDSHKIGHRNEDVREKSQSLIRMIKEYARRGELDEGVPVVTNKVYLRTVATELKAMPEVPSLDLNSVDDRLVASALLHMREHPRSVIAVVTRDINLQNKCRYYCVPFLEPPEPGDQALAISKKKVRTKPRP